MNIKSKLNLQQIFFEEFFEKNKRIRNKREFVKKNKCYERQKSSENLKSFPTYLKKLSA